MDGNMFKIEKPGIYTDVPVADYFADPCPRPSLTQSVAKILIEKSPLHAWHAHSRLNPDYFPDNSTSYDTGNVAHKLLLKRGKDIEVVDGYDDWRTKVAKERPEMALNAGKIAVLGRTMERASNMVTAARIQLEMHGLHSLFDDRKGDAEVVLAWQEGDIWLRQMVDWLSYDRTIFCDYKTTDMSVAAHGLGRMMVNAGWPIQAAMAERGLKALKLLDDLGQIGHERRYLFVVQETEPPYCLNVVEMSDGAMTMGGKMLDMAVTIWRHCMANDRWPGYPPEVVTPEYPGWAESQWLEREVKDAARERMPNDTIMAG
jgi:PDDEXK-like domain of unknown function (DUF3799)